MTVADRLAAAVVLLAGAFVAWACSRAGTPGLATLAGVAASGLFATQVFSWTRSRREPRLVLQRLADGRFQARRGAGPTVPLRIGAQTRLLCPSVFLDVTFASTSTTGRCRCWITPLDAPAAVLRRWSVLLPGAGSLAS